MAYKKNARIKVAVGHKRQSFKFAMTKPKIKMAILDIPTEREQQIKQAAYERKREMLIANAKY